MRQSMRQSVWQRAAATVAGLACASAMAAAHAAPVSLTVPLTGNQQVPPVQTSGNGSAALTYDAATHVVTWKVTYSGLSSDATMAHFHAPAAAGKNAPPVIWLTKKGSTAISSPISGEATLTPEQARQFLAGDMYINVHTKDHPSGEIRGQVQPPK